MNEHVGVGRKYGAARKLVRQRVISNKPLNTRALEKEHGISVDVFERAALAERARNEVLEELGVDPNTLSTTAAQKLEVAIRQHKRKLDQEFEARIQIEYKARFDKHFPDMQKRYNEAFREKETYRKFMDQQKKVFTPDQFKVILMCLHPDGERSAGKLTEAFRLFNAKRFALTGEK